MTYMTSESSKPKSEALNKSLELGRFTCLELSAVGLPGMPTTEQGWGKLVARELWQFVEVHAKGGKKGVKREYTPPPALLELIRRHLRGEPVTEEEVRRARGGRLLEQAPGHARPAADGGHDLPEPEPSGKTLPELPVALAMALGRVIQAGGWVPLGLPLEQCDQIVKQALTVIGRSLTLRQQAALLKNEAALDAALQLSFAVIHVEP